MRLPAHATITREKLTRYLLVHQSRGDKSAFFTRAGYNLENADQLLADLRTQLLPLDVAPLHSTAFGKFYEIRGVLTGPNGVALNVAPFGWKRGCLESQNSLPWSRKSKNHALRTLH